MRNCPTSGCDGSLDTSSVGHFGGPSSSECSLYSNTQSRVVSSDGSHRHAARSTRYSSTSRKGTPSASRRSRITSGWPKCQPPERNPMRFTTRWAGRSPSAELCRKVQPTIRAERGEPIARAISPYVVTRPTGIAATTPCTRSANVILDSDMEKLESWNGADRIKPKRVAGRSILINGYCLRAAG